jgi:hypothetical protein
MGHSNMDVVHNCGALCGALIIERTSKMYDRLPSAIFASRQRGTVLS